MKDEDASAAMLDFERLWSEYCADRQNDATQYGGSSGSAAHVNNYADEYTKPMVFENDGSTNFEKLYPTGIHGLKDAKVNPAEESDF